MGKTKRSDEEVLSALMSQGTITAAAQSLGLSERTIFDRMNEPDFRGLYKAARADLLRETVSKLRSQIGAAINVIAEIMQDPEATDSVRLQAAESIMENAARFFKRLDDTEKRISEQKQSDEIDRIIDFTF